MKRRVATALAAVSVCGLMGLAAYRLPMVKMGKQPDGGFMVSSGQRIEPGTLAFDGRPIDIALHPSGAFFAVLNQRNVFLANKEGIVPDSTVPLAHGAGYRGAAWTLDGKRLFVSVSQGYVQELILDGEKLAPGQQFDITPPHVERKAFKKKNDPENPFPGGMAITKDRTRLFVVSGNRNAVAEIDLIANRWVKEYPVQNLPFEVRLSEDEKTLLVSNWGGREAKEGERTAPSEDLDILVDERGAPASGTVSLIERASGATKHVEVGLHPTSIAVQGGLAYIANAASDSISVLDIAQAKVVRTLPIKWGNLSVFGSMPNALAVRDKTLYICNGGDNAVCEMDIPSGKVRGFRPAGYYPTGIQLSADGKTAYVVNTKGNGSVRNTVKGLRGNAHDYQGTVSILDLTADLRTATEQVAANNHWNGDRADLRPDLAVYKGAIKHVLYIIKENRTYDQVFGDLPQGNGDPTLCDLGEKITPNHRAIAQQFTLFDNGYVSGTNSADGHAWSTQSLANDYLEHFYTGYRTYPDDGDCAMSIPSSGHLWDAAAKKGKSIRVYGEFCDDRLAKFEPMPASWLDMWRDRENKTNKYHVRVGTRVAGLKKYIHPSFVYWPLLQSDQHRADLFVEEYTRLSREDRVPNLMIMSLPCDHGEGMNPQYPKFRSMVADNDLALGRVVEAVSKSPQWKETCIFVIEDDAQSGPDHVDGHRTVYMAISPYVRRKFVDSTFCTTVSMIRSIELMLGLDPMNRFDTLTPPLATCFSDTPDLSPYTAVPNLTRLDDMNLPRAALKTPQERRWFDVSAKLDWSGLDHPDPELLNRVNWVSLHGPNVPYPNERQQSLASRSAPSR